MSTTAAPAAGPPIAGSQPFIHGRGDAPAYWWQDILWIILAHGDETGGRWSLMEQLLPRGAGTPPHKHVWSDETFYILDGELTFLVGGEIRTARAGEFVNVPRNTPHGFRVDSGTARFLNGYTPASLEAAVADLAAPTTQRTLPPKGLTSPAMLTPEQFARYGMEMVAGPNPLRP